MVVIVFIVLRQTNQNLRNKSYKKITANETRIWKFKKLAAGSGPPG